QRTLRIAARLGDCWNGIGPVELIRDRVIRLHELCEREGRDPESLEISANMRVLVTQGAAETTRLVEWFAKVEGMSVRELRERIVVGTPNEISYATEPYLDIGVKHLILQPVGSSAPISALPPVRVLMSGLVETARAVSQRSPKGALGQSRRAEALP
ncbi:MAG: hypothetical protein ACE5FA_13030, partial [Dehalococcoidia bacterium]